MQWSNREEQGSKVRLKHWQQLSHRGDSDGDIRVDNYFFDETAQL